MNNCEIISRILSNLDKIDEIVPYDLSGFDVDTVREICLIMAKYSKDENRRKICENKAREL